MKKLFYTALISIFLLALVGTILADVKVRQKMTMNGQTFETTKMIKGSRERSENKIQMQGAAADMIPQIATITQCDLRRTVMLNDKKKIYTIEPFAVEETGNQTTAPAVKTDNPTRRGGTMTITYTIVDTGERQTLFGLQARHLKITQEMESSADSCNGASKSKMEFDGWYVDFSAEFNCPIDVPQIPMQREKPDCVDRIVSKRVGTAKPGFLLNGTMKIFDADGREQMMQTIETLELSRDPLAQSLFEIPQDYKQVNSAQELYSMPDMQDIMKNDNANEPTQNPDNPGVSPETSGVKSIGLNISFPSGANVNQPEITKFVQEKVRGDDLQMRLNSTGDNLDYVLNVVIKQAKESTGGKIGGLFGKVTGVDVKAGKTDVDVIVTLINAKTKEQIRQKRIAQKFDGSATDAVREAVGNALDDILQNIK